MAGRAVGAGGSVGVACGCAGVDVAAGASGTGAAWGAPHPTRSNTRSVTPKPSRSSVCCSSWTPFTGGDQLPSRAYLSDGRFGSPSFDYTIKPGLLPLLANAPVVPISNRADLCCSLSRDRMMAGSMPRDGALSKVLFSPLQGLRWLSITVGRETRRVPIHALFPPCRWRTGSVDTPGSPGLDRWNRTRSGRAAPGPCLGGQSDPQRHL